MSQRCGVKDGNVKKKKKKETCHNSSISLFFRHSDFIFQLNFSPMENGYLRMQNLPRRNWKKAEHTIIYFPPRLSSLHLWGWTIVFEELSTLTSTLATLNMVENTRYQSRITESRFIPVLSGRFETNDFDDERKR